MSTTIETPRLVSPLNLAPVIAPAGLTWNEGDFFTVAADGTLSLALAAGADSGPSTRLTHFATSTRTTPTTAGEIVYLHKIVIGSNVFTGSLADDDAVAAYSNAFIGDSFDLRRTTTSKIFVVNSTSQANPVVKVTGFTDNTSGDTCGSVQFEVLYNKCL